MCVSRVSVKHQEVKNFTKMFLHVICVTCLLFSAVSTVEFEPCKTGVPAPKSVEVNNCDKPPCQLTPGTKLNISTEFTTDEVHTEVLLGMTTKYMGMNQGYPGVDGSAQCANMFSMPDNVKVSCPLHKAGAYRHELVINLKFPPTSSKIILPVKYSLKDKTTKKEFVCFELKMAIGGE